MKWILIILGVFPIAYGLMWGLMFIYALFEKLVHAVDKKALSQQQLERILWIVSIILSIAIVLCIIISQY